MSAEDMKTTEDALRWALRRIQHSIPSAVSGDYFERADALLRESEQRTRTVHVLHGMRFAVHVDPSAPPDVISIVSADGKEVALIVRDKK